MSKRILMAASILMLSSAAPIIGLETTQGPMTHGQMAQPMSDKLLTSKIKEALADNPTLSKFMKDVDIKVDEGVVSLHGKVGSSMISSRIETTVKSVAGVQGIENNLKIDESTMK